MKKQSRKPLTFMEALEAELRKEIREEVAKEFATEGGSATQSRATEARDFAQATAHERLELWLSARVSTKAVGASRSTAFQGYSQQNSIKSEYAGTTSQSAKASVMDAVAEAVQAAHAFMNETSHATPATREHALDVMDIAALEFFRRNGVTLNQNFDESDLKSAYRKLALKFHPDRHASADEVTRARFSGMFAQVSEQTKRLSRHLAQAHAA